MRQASRRLFFALALARQDASQAGSVTAVEGGDEGLLQQLLACGNLVAPTNTEFD
jgi:hypothetical protein